MGGAVGGAGAPTNTGLQGNNGSQQAGVFGGMPMASPMDSAVSQMGQQQQNQQQNQQFNQPPPAGGFGPFGLGTLQSGGSDTGFMSDNGRLSGQGQQQFNPASDEGMVGPGWQPQQQQQQQQQTSLGNLQAQMGPGGALPSQPNPYKQNFGFGGAYGQQAQSRMGSQYQPQQQGFNQQPQMQGLQQLLSRMMGGYQNRPQYGSQPSTSSPMPSYTTAASTYKPDYVRAQEALNRTATTKAEAQAAATSTDKTQEQLDDDAGFAAWQRRQYEASKNPYGSGGGGA